jgi:hypothetical protein
MAVKSLRVTASGAITSAPCKVLSVRGLGGSGGGTVTLKDGGSSGTALLELDSPSGGAFGGNIPGGGIPFATSCYATLGSTNPAGVTVIYEDYA